MNEIVIYEDGNISIEIPIEKDGKKRIGAFLFILFLQKNQMLYRSNGEAKINDNALVVLTLMTAKSLPEQKDTVIALVVNMLVEGSIDDMLTIDKAKENSEY